MVDYSKWKNIEISDDEDDTHPNIDTPSLFRWRHQARVERMAQLEQEKEQLNNRRQSHKARLLAAQEKLKNKTVDETNIKSEIEDLEKEGKKLDAEEQAFYKKEVKQPWNVDTISKPGFEKTVLNKSAVRKPQKELTDEEMEELLKKFIKENEKLCKEYGMYQKYDDSKRFLQKHPQLVCEEAAHYLVIWAINLMMEDKTELMAHVAHQTICMQYILELAKTLEVDPRSCISSFFTKIQNCMPEYREQFEQEIESFKERVTKRAKEKVAAALAEAEEDERKARLGPGGLDPAEVFEELPDELKNCFESRDIEMLKRTIAAMPVDVARYHMKRCVDSGLWVPGADDEPNKDEEQTTGTGTGTGTDDAKSAAVEETTKPQTNKEKA